VYLGSAELAAKAAEIYRYMNFDQIDAQCRSARAGARFR
jgi:aconitase B